MAFKTVTEISYEQVTKSKVVCEQDCTWTQIYDLGTLLCNEAIEQMKARQPKAQDDASMPAATATDILDATPAV